MYDKVKATIAKFEMVSPGDRIVVGVSGGPDSLVLAHILARLADEEGFSLHVAHLNHMFRGRDADEDARCVAEFAAKLGLPCTIEKIDVPAYLKKYNLSAQKGAREVRYSFFNRLMIALGANKVATGHHADDQAETVLMNILRGSGLAGLSGIPPQREGIYIRPLFEVTREEINGYCNEYNLPVRYDKSNEKTIYLRNKVRHQLIPFLKKEFNPNITETLMRLSEIARDEDRFLSLEAEKYQQQIFEKSGYNELVINLRKFNELPMAIQRRLLIKAWEKVTGSERDLMFAHVGRLLDFLKQGPTTGLFELPRDVRVRKSYDQVRLFTGKPGATPEVEYPLAVPGETRVPELDVKIITEVVPANLNFEESPEKTGTIFVNYDRLKGKLAVRNRRPGDRFRPLGLQGTKKLKDFFVDLKIPAEDRDRYPLITAGDEIVSVGGLRLDDRWKVTGDTKQVLRIKIIHKIEP